MKAIPLPFEDFQGKGVLDFSSSPDSYNLYHHNQRKLLSKKETCCFLVGNEPTSVLATRRSPNPPISSPTLSSSQGANSGGGGGGTSTDTTPAAAAAISGGNPSGEKCSGQGPVQLGMEDWESVLSGSPSQEQSILKLIMGDIEDPSMGLNKMLQVGGAGTGSHHQEMEFNAGFGVVDQAFGFEPMSSANVGEHHPPPFPPHLHVSQPDFPLLNARLGSVFNPNPNPLFPGMFPPHQQHGASEGVEEKPQVTINQNQHQFGQNPAMFLPLTYAPLQEHHLLSPPAPKRLNSGNYQVPKAPFSDANPPPELLLQRQPHMFQQQRPNAMMKQKIVGEELANQQQLQQAIINPICQAAELIETGNPVLAQGILARLNHQLSLPIGKPHVRAAYFFKEALQSLVHMNSANHHTSLSASSLIFKIGAYKSFSEISPILQFSNFTCNQALLEAFEGVDRIHIIDFDIGYGGQWASLMQELALRNGGAPSLKITAFASLSSHNELELRFTQENLSSFASDIHMPFDLEILSLDLLNSGSWPMPLNDSEKEVIGVNLPLGSFSNYPSSLPLVLRFVRQLSPKIVVSMDRGCDRADLPFAHHVNHAMQSYSSLLESLDAVNMNPDALHKVERFMIQPCIEKIVLGRHRCLDRTLPWRSLFLQTGFTPLTFSNFTESQAEYLVQRTPTRGFHVEKRQSSLVLCWQRKELISASAWRC